MKLIEIVNAYGVLGEAKMSTVELDDVLKAVKARKAMRPYVEEWESYLKDLREKCAPKMEADPKAAEAEFNKAIEAELGREIELEMEKLGEKAVAAIVKENGLKMREVDMLGIML